MYFPQSIHVIISFPIINLSVILNTLMLLIFQIIVSCSCGRRRGSDTRLKPKPVSWNRQNLSAVVASGADDKGVHMRNTSRAVSVCECRSEDGSVWVVVFPSNYLLVDSYFRDYVKLWSELFRRSERVVQEFSVSLQETAAAGLHTDSFCVSSQIHSVTAQTERSDNNNTHNNNNNNEQIWCVWAATHSVAVLVFIPLLHHLQPFLCSLDLQLLPLWTRQKLVNTLGWQQAAGPISLITSIFTFSSCAVGAGSSSSLENTNGYKKQTIRLRNWHRRTTSATGRTQTREGKEKTYCMKPKRSMTL